MTDLFRHSFVQDMRHDRDVFLQFSLFLEIDLGRANDEALSRVVMGEVVKQDAASASETGSAAAKRTGRCATHAQLLCLAKFLDCVIEFNCLWFGFGKAVLDVC